MIFISHRGNLTGVDPSLENHPSYIDIALREKFDCEIDIRYINNNFYLGHDEGTYPITLEWIESRKDNLWIHCKDIQSIEFFSKTKDFHYFWHEQDTLTLTSKNYIWAFPGKQPIHNSIAVLPEYKNDSLDACIGVCSDLIEVYFKQLQK
jgi:hypothetical protein